jgi:hypothetical protein
MPAIRQIPMQRPTKSLMPMPMQIPMHHAMEIPMNLPTQARRRHV